VNFDTLGYQALKKALVGVLEADDIAIGQNGVHSGVVVLPVNCGLAASIRCVFANPFLPYGTQIDTGHQWLSWCEKALLDANLPIEVTFNRGVIEMSLGEEIYTLPYLHVKPVLVEIVAKKKYSLV
jgi:hypothetical protein